MSAPKNNTKTAAPAANTAVHANTAPAAPSHFEYAIEEGIPLPTKRVNVKGVSAYPFAKLKIGASFFVPVTERSKEPWKTLTSMASRMSRDLHPMHFVTSREKNAEGIDGVRIWRGADATGPLPEPTKRGPRKPKVEAAAEQPAPEQPNGGTAADPFANGPAI